MGFSTDHKKNLQGFDPTDKYSLRNHQGNVSSQQMETTTENSNQPKYRLLNLSQMDAPSTHPHTSGSRTVR